MTYFGINPERVIPGVMWVHVLLFVPFIAGLVMLKRSRGRSYDLFDDAPHWMRWVVGIFFAYAAINFVSFFVLSEGGARPRIDAGRYVLSLHGDLIRELSEDEFHLYGAYVVRVFSGHWMLLASFALLMMTSAKRASDDLRERQTPAIEARRHRLPSPWAAHFGEGRSSGEDCDQEAVEIEWLPEGKTPELESRGLRPGKTQTQAVARGGSRRNLPAEPASSKTGYLGLGLFTLCVVLILTRHPGLNVLALGILVVFAVLSIRRRRGFPQESFESMTGCFAVFPSFFVAGLMGKTIAELTYVLVIVGLSEALGGSVEVLIAEDRPAQLSNGDPLRGRYWGAASVFILFPTVVVGLLGLTHLAEYVGRYLEIGRKRKALRTP